MDGGRVEHIFDYVSDAGLIDGIGAASRAESAALARRLALIGELDARRAAELVERRWWRVDPFLEVAAEVAAALNISRSRVGDQIHLARVLRDELPAVAAVFATGAIDYRMVDTIISRTDNVELDRKPAVDAAIARHCVKWMRLSKPKLRDRVDLWVAKHDPAAVRVPPKVDDSRYIEVGETSAGMAGIWANVRSSDAAVFDRRLEALAATVCDLDPRTKQQRRSDALGPLARRADTLACQCGSPDCAAGAERKIVGEIVIHVLAEQATVVGTSDQPGYLPGFGILPAESVRDLAQTATVKPLAMPDGAEPGYRPSPTLAQFVRFRDLTCRFPGCDAPARCATSTTPPRIRMGRRIRRTPSCTAAPTICSKRSTPGSAGLTVSSLTAPWFLRLRPDTPTAPKPTAAPCFPRWPNPPATWARSKSPTNRPTAR